MKKIISGEDCPIQKKREKIFKDLHKIAVKFKDLKNEKEICQMTVKSAENLLDFNLCNFLLVKKGKFRAVASSSNFNQKVLPITETSIAAKTYQQKKSFIIDDLQNHHDSALVKEIYKSAISIPIASYGVFQAAAPEKKAFDERDLELAEILISHAAAALNIIYAQEKINEQKIYFEQLFNNSTEAIALLDKKHRVIKVNKKFETLFGFKQAEIINKDIDNFILPEEAFLKGEKYTARVKKGQKIQGEEIRKNKNGDRINVFLQGFPIKMADGQIGSYALYNDITERKKKEKQVEYLSFHDEMTGLYNRRYFENELKRLGSSRKYPITVLIGDLDGLKIINDTYGHKKGDEYIINTADILKSTARSEDIIARIGGDEFAIILPSTDSEEAENFCRRIRQNIAKFNHNNNQITPLSISIGFEVMKNSSQNLDDIFIRADKKMYLNKGKN